MRSGRCAYPLIINNNDLLDMPEAAELVIQITFGGTNAQSEHPQHVGGIGRLLRMVSTIRVQWPQTRLTMGA